MRISSTVILLLFTISLFFAHCATIIHGSQQNVIVTSEPIHTNVNIDGFNKGQTPTMVRLTRNDKHIIRVGLPGFEPYETVLTRKLDAWILGNIIFGGIIGIAIDAASGSMYHLSQSDVYMELQKTNHLTSAAKNGVYISVVLQPEKDWQKIGTLTKINTNSLLNESMINGK